MRILLACAVVFLAAWFTVLRPKSEDAAPATTTTAPTGNVNTGQPAESSVGKVVEKAKDAANQAEGAAKAAAGESADSSATKAEAGSATATTSQPPASEALPELPAATLAKLPKDVAGALQERKVLVLAVLADDAKRWRPLADDDRYVRNTLKKVNRYDGDVFVKQVPLGKLYSYGPIVNDLKVNQTPSVVVVDRKLQANVIPGYLDRISINQAIADARAASIDPLITDDYLRKANAICANGNVGLERWSLPTIPGKKARIAAVKRASALNRSYIRAITRVAAPKRWSSLKVAWLKQLRAEQKFIDEVAVTARKDDVAGLIAALNRFDTKAARKLDNRFNEAGLTSCANNRRV